MEEGELFRFRKPDWPVDGLFWRRWSPRAMSGEEITRDELMTLFEAARWAPSAFNAQPWHFLFARRNTPHWNLFFNVLDEGNQRWCRNAAVLIAVISKGRHGHGSVHPASFDAGAAWMSLALEGEILGLVVHAMKGFDDVRARTALAVPADWIIEAMVAAGRHGAVADLPEEKRAEEFPKGRKPVGEFVSEGPFPKIAEITNPRDGDL